MENGQWTIMVSALPTILYALFRLFSICPDFIMGGLGSIISSDSGFSSFSLRIQIPPPVVCAILIVHYPLKQKNQHRVTGADFFAVY